MRPPTVSPEQHRAAKRQVIEQIEQGASVQQAMSQSVVPIQRSRPNGPRVPFC